MQAFCSSLSNWAGWASQSILSSSSSSGASSQTSSALPLGLVNSPEFFLKDNSVWFSCSDPLPLTQSDTFRQEYAVYDRIGFSDGLYLSQNAEKTTSSGQINALFTPVRISGSAERHAIPAKFSVENNSLWLTAQQTGCVVVVIKWPKSGNPSHQYAMLHLEPNNWDDNPDNKTLIETMWKKGNGVGISSFQDAHLRKELSSIFWALSANDIQPESYALSFSSFDDQCYGISTQVVGVAKDNEFVFFEQKTEGAADMPSSCKELSFSAWRNFQEELKG